MKKITFAFLIFTVFFGFAKYSSSEKAMNLTDYQFYKKNSAYSYGEDFLNEFRLLLVNFGQKFNQLDKKQKARFVCKLKKALKQEKDYLESYYKLMTRIGKASDSPNYKTHFPYGDFASGSKMDLNVQLAIEILKDYPEFLEGKIPDDFLISNVDCHKNDTNLICKPIANGVITLLLIANKIIDNSNYINEENILQSAFLDTFLIFNEDFYNELKLQNKLEREEDLALNNSFFISKNNNNFLLNAVYNGYIFGGNKDPYYPKYVKKNKKYHGEDCSSYILKQITNEKNFLKGQESTLFIYFLDLLNEEAKDPENMYKNRMVLLNQLPFLFKMQDFFKKNRYHLFKVQGLKEVQPGDILIFRYFNNNFLGANFGSRGHIGFVMNKTEDNSSIELFSLRRDYKYFDKHITIKDRIIEFFKFRSKKYKYLEGYNSYLFEDLTLEKNLKDFSLLILRQDKAKEVKEIYDFEFLRKLYLESFK